jgi:anaerobic selenocysteine-containing dehydrogenase
VYHAPDGEAFAKALAKVPMVVSFSSFMDESTKYADLILPDQNYLERWQDDTVTHLSGFSLFSLGRPAIKPVVDAKNSMEVLFDIAKKLGGGVASAFPWNKYEELLRKSVSGLLEAGRGYIVSTPHEEAFRNVLERQGYRIPEYKANDDFWEGLLAAGAWWDPSDSYKGARDLLAGPRRTFDFYSMDLKKRFEDEARRISAMTGVTVSQAQENLVKMMKVKVEGDSIFIPHQEPEEKGSSKEYPFYLNTYKLHSLYDGAGANQPWLQESMAIHLDEKWHNWVEINPQTARQLGIRDGDLVWLETDRGAIKIKAKLYEGALPQVVNVPLGEGHTDYGRWADDNADYATAIRKGYAKGHPNYKHWIQERGPNPNQIVDDTIDPFTGLALVNQTRVKIRKA